MNLNELQTRDIVSLNELEFNKFDLRELNNLFQITSIEDNKIFLEGFKDSFNISQLKPVQIGGELDKDIFYNTVINAPMLADRQEPKSFTIDKSCYLDKIYEDGETFRELAERQKITEVHKLQHYLKEDSACGKLLNKK